MEEKKMELPPGLQFDPTDEELILCLREKSLPSNPNIIPDLDIYASDPWDLNDRKAYRSSKSEWYFFSKTKQNRSTRKGFWKEVGLSEPICTSDGNEIGIKNYLVYWGDDETDWFMEEYRLLDNGVPRKLLGRTQTAQRQDESGWVLCRVHNEANRVDHPRGIKDFYPQSSNEDGVELSYLDEIFLSLEDDDQDEITSLNYIDQIN